MRSKKTISKGIENAPIKWIVTHPNGHVYSMPRIENLLASYSSTKAALEAAGWKFEPIYQNAEI